MAEPQNRNYNDLTDRHNAVLESLEALETKNRMLKEEIAWMETAKLRHFFLIGLLFCMLVPVPIYFGAIYLCVTKNKNVPWFLILWNIFSYGLLLFAAFYLVMNWVETANQAMCEPLRELLGMAEAQEADRRELQQEEEAIRRAHERRRCHEQIRQHLREMAGRGRDAEDEDMAQCTICLEQLNFYGGVTILTCKHIFHRACIELWLPHNDTCPVCRTKIESYYYWRRIWMDDDD